MHSPRGREWAGHRAVAAWNQGKEVTEAKESPLPLLAAPLVAGPIGTLGV